MRENELSSKMDVGGGALNWRWESATHSFADDIAFLKVKGEP